MRQLTARPVAVVCIVVSAIALGGANAASGGATNGPGITVHYSGHFETRWPTSTSTAFPKGIPGDIAHAELDWRAVATVSYAQLNQGVRVHWHYVRLLGAYQYTLLPSPGSTDLKCRETLTEVPGYENTEPDALNLAFLSFNKHYEVYAATPFNNLAVTTRLPPANKCAAFAYWPNPGASGSKAAKFGAAYQPSFAVARGKSLTKRWPTVTWLSPTQDAYDTIEASLTISAAR